MKKDHETDVKILTAALEECLEYFEHYSDVVDGDDGQPEPNREMSLASMINHVLGRV